MPEKHSHSHSHLQINKISSFRLFITLLMNLLITAVEIIGGILSGSLSLISDALHNLTDAISIIVSYIAIKLSRISSSENFTFGLKRGEILAAVVNTSVLIVISCFLFVEAYNRFMTPEKVSGSIMTIVAAVGLFANIIGTLLLKKGADSSINIRSTYLHLLSDAVTSVGVIIGGVCIWLWNIYWIDPLLTVLISLYILRESISILKDAIVILMMGKPKNISLTELKNKLETIPEIKNIHHAHLWSLTDQMIHFEAHIDIEDMPVSDSESLLAIMEKKLIHNYGISHITIQFETGKCPTKSLLCSH